MAYTSGGSRKAGRELGAMISSSLPTSRTPLPPHWKDRPSPSADLQPPSATPVLLPALSDAHSLVPEITTTTPPTEFTPPVGLFSESDPAGTQVTLTQNRANNLPSVLFKSPSKPIPIPIKSLSRNKPTTPLTGRLEIQGGYFPQHFYSTSSNDKATLPPSTQDEKQQVSHKSGTPPAMVTERPSRLYTPTSPLSPTMNPSMHPISPQAPHSPTKPRSMRLNLPRYHPQAYQSPNRAPSNTSQPSYRPSSPLGHASSYYRVPSDSQKALRQYQRDLIANAKFSSSVAATPGSAKPAAPRLDPLGSPGPVTPLALEEDGGSYLTAGMGGEDSPAMSGEEDSADLVDKCIRKENKRWEKKSRASRDMKSSPVLGTMARE